MMPPGGRYGTPAGEHRHGLFGTNIAQSSAFPAAFPAPAPAAFPAAEPAWMATSPVALTTM
jgi:hypothetical protein